MLAGRLLTALVCEYLEWAQLDHTLKVYLPECNLVIIDLLFCLGITLETVNSIFYLLSFSAKRLLEG